MPPLARRNRESRVLRVPGHAKCERLAPSLSPPASTRVRIGILVATLVAVLVVVLPGRLEGWGRCQILLCSVFAQLVAAHAHPYSQITNVVLSSPKK